MTTDVVTTVAATVMLDELQADQTLLFGLWLRSFTRCGLSGDQALCRWSGGRVGGAAAAALVVELVRRVVDEAVGSRWTAALNTDGHFRRPQGPLNAVRAHAEHVGVCEKESLPC